MTRIRYASIVRGIVAKCEVDAEYYQGCADHARKGGAKATSELFDGKASYAREMRRAITHAIAKQESGR